MAATFARLERVWPTLRGGGATLNSVLFPAPSLSFSSPSFLLSSAPTSSASVSSSSAAAAAAAAGSSATGVSALWIRAGHVVIALRQRTVVLALDVVPPSSAGSEAAQQALAQLLQSPSLTEFSVVPDSLNGLLFSVAASPVVQVIWVEPATNPGYANASGGSSSSNNSSGGGGGVGGNASAGANGASGGGGGAGSASAGSAGSSSSALAGSATATPTMQLPQTQTSPALWIVRENGAIEGWQFSRRRSTWMRTVRAKLPSERPLQLRDFQLERFTVGEPNALVAYMETYTDKRGLEVCDVSAVGVHIDESLGDMVMLNWSAGPPKVLLRAVPPVAIVNIEGGIAFLPKSCAPLDTPEPVALALSPTSFSHNSSSGGSLNSGSGSGSSSGAATGQRAHLCYFWASGGGASSPTVSVVWGRPPSTATTALSALQAMATDASPESTASPQDLPRIVAYTTHPVTRELLVLDTNLDVTVCTLVDGTLSQRILVQLQRSSSGRSPQGAVRLAVHRLFLVVLDDTAAHFFSMHTGHMVNVVTLPTEAAQSKHTSAWQSTGAASQVGVWCSQGIWQLQHGRVTEMLSAPVANEKAAIVRADAIFAAEMWSLERFQAMHILNAAYILSMHTKTPDGKQEETAVKAALTLLRREMVEAPALVIALLDAFPQQRRQLHSVLTKFIDDFNAKQNEGLTEAAAAMGAFRVRTGLNQRLYTFVEDYVAMLDEHPPLEDTPVLVSLDGDVSSTGGSAAASSSASSSAPTPTATAAGPRMSSDSAPPTPLSTSSRQPENDALYILRNDVAEETASILRRAASRFRQSKTSAETSEDRARIESLAVSHPSVILTAIEQFLMLKGFDEASVPDGDDLAMLDYFFREESLPDVGVKANSVRSPRLLLFELYASLLIQLRPTDLENMILFAHSCTMKALSIRTKAGLQRTNNTRLWKRDSQKLLETFRRRALQVVVPPEASTVLTWAEPTASIRAISQLMVTVEEAPSAVRFLLSLERTDDAISLVNELMNGDRDIVEHVELFHTLFSIMLEGGHLTRDVIDRLWEVIPRNYSVYDLLSLLRSLDPAAGNGEVVTSDTTSLTVGVIRPQLIKLINRELRRRPTTS